ncbi:MAG: FAD-dependent oxidoreductase [Candidatus Pacearchaeota archaeon]
MAAKKENKNKAIVYDVIVIGAGVAGLSAAMYGARLGLKVLCLGASHGPEMPIGGVITTTKLVENYPGFKEISGAELAERIRKHAESYELVKIKEEIAESVEKEQKTFLVKTNKGEYGAKTIIFATGTKWRRLDIPGSKEFENKGVTYCALCDAPLFRNKVVAVIGGSDSALKEALLLKEYAKKIYIIYRGEKVRAEPITLKKVEADNKIEIINKTNVVEIRGDKLVQSIVLDKPYKGSKELETNGVLVAIGHEPLTEIAKKVGVEINEKGEIIIDHENCETNVKGVYAAGDVTNKKFKQAIIGVAEGCTAAYSAYEYIKSL